MLNTDPIIALLEKQVELLAEESQRKKERNEWEALPGLGKTMVRAAAVIAELSGTAPDNVVKLLSEQVQLLSEAKVRRFSGELIVQTEAMIELARICIQCRYESEDKENR